MRATLVLVKTVSPPGDIEDVFDLDVDVSLDLDGCRAIAVQVVGEVKWIGDMGTATIDGHGVEVEATEMGLLWLRFADLAQDSAIVQRVAAKSTQLGLAVIDEDSAELLRGGLDV